MADLEYPSVPVPRWETAHPDPAASCIAQIDAWTGSEAMRQAAAAFGGRVPDPLEERLLWLDDFSAEHWDYRRGKERNLVEEPVAEDHTVRVAVAAAEALGLRSDSPPTRDEYDAVLVLGGLVRACLVRPLYAAALVRGGLRADEVTALGGFRPLAGDELRLAAKAGIRQEADEFWAMVAGMDAAFGPLPEPDVQRKDGDNANASSLVHTYQPDGAPLLRVVAAPSTDPATRRANSKDTYAFWAEHVAHLPRGAHVLLVTTSIYVPYQGCAAIEALGVEHGIAVETVGTAMTPPVFADDPQQFLWHHYFQELRSAVRGMRSLHSRLTTV